VLGALDDHVEWDSAFGGAYESLGDPRDPVDGATDHQKSDLGRVDDILQGLLWEHSFIGAAVD
jgi:hypothetical protein